MGGSGIQAFRLADALSQTKRYQSHFLSYDTPFKKPTGNLILHQPSPYQYALFPFNLNESALVEKIIETTSKYQINTVHAHYSIFFGNSAVLAQNILQKTKQNTIKTIITFHGSDTIGFDPEHPGRIVPRHINTWILNQADTITAPSQALANQIKNIYHTNRQVTIIPNFIDPKIFKPCKPRNQLPTILHISNYRKVKNALSVAKIFKYIQEKVPNAQLNLIGEGPELNSIEQFAYKHHLTNINIKGVIKSESAIAEQLSQAHLTLVPSIFESFSLVALESLACGTPVISSNRGGLPEVVTQNQTGYLYDLKDLTNMAASAIKLLRDQTLWQKFSHNALSSSQKFHQSKIIPKYQKLYN